MCEPFSIDNELVTQAMKYTGLKTKKSGDRKRFSVH